MKKIANKLTNLTVFSNQALREVYATKLKDILYDKLQEPLTKENLRVFLKRQRCAENLSFLESVEEYKSLVGNEKEEDEIVVEVGDKDEAVYELLKEMKERFFTEGSLEVVNLSYELRKKMENEIDVVLESARKPGATAELEDIYDVDMFKETESEILSLISLGHKQAFLKRASTYIISERHKNFYLKCAILAFILFIVAMCLAFLVLDDLIVYRLIAAPFIFGTIECYLIYHNRFCPVFAVVGVYEKPQESLSMLKVAQLPFMGESWRSNFSDGKFTRLVLEPRLRNIHKRMLFVLETKSLTFASIIMLIIMFLPPDGLYDLL